MDGLSEELRLEREGADRVEHCITRRIEKGGYTIHDIFSQLLARLGSRDRWEGSAKSRSHASFFLITVVLFDDPNDSC
jgi:hypothetical protein